LGRKEEALKLEQEVVGMKPRNSDYLSTYKKMLNNEPTWNTKK
jgi:hypothetical protein